MHEVAIDDFGLSQKGHYGMYTFMTAAFDATSWVDSQYKVNECVELSEFLYKTGVVEHKVPMNFVEHNQSIMDALMVSIASELWNAREYNFIVQSLQEKLLSTKPALGNNIKDLRDAKGYVMGHAGEVEIRHGLHALAAAQVIGRTRGLPFQIDRFKEIMLDYNNRIGKALSSLHNALVLIN
jgi:hypothetical protein